MIYDWWEWYAEECHANEYDGNENDDINININDA